MKGESIGNNLGELRRQRGISAIALAKAAGVTRQTVYAIESGAYVPNTAVALHLSRALGTSVEELFTLPETAAAEALKTEPATLLADAGSVSAGQPVQLCRVDRKLIAAPSLSDRWWFPAADAVIVPGAAARGKTPVAVFEPQGREFEKRILVAGCDPGISVLSRHAQRAGLELVLAHRNSAQALALLHAGSIHIAGTHLRDEASGESNLPEVERLFSKSTVAVVSFAIWELGIVAAHGNPKQIRGFEDLSRPDVTLINREPGAGARALLDAGLKKHRIAARAVKGYGSVAQGHLSVARQVRRAKADCGLATRAVARMFGLHFIPLVSERYDFVIRRQHLELPRMQNLLDTMARSGFRRELDGLGGYDMRVAGQRVM